MTFLVNADEVHTLDCVDLGPWIDTVFRPYIMFEMSMSNMETDGLKRSIFTDRDYLDVLLSSVMLKVLGHDRHITNYATVAEVIAEFGGINDFTRMTSELFSKGTTGRAILEEIEMYIDKTKPYVIIGSRFYYIKLGIPSRKKD